MDILIMNEQEMKPTPEVVNSLKHWFRMRRYVRRLIKNGRRSKPPLCMRMNDEIGEVWNVNHCALCVRVNEECNRCPLGKNNSRCTSENSAYMKVNYSATWAEWLAASGDMIRALWNCRYIPIG
jgi:hypothetical protein